MSVMVVQRIKYVKIHVFSSKIKYILNVWNNCGKDWENWEQTNVQQPHITSNTTSGHRSGFDSRPPCIQIRSTMSVWLIFEYGVSPPLNISHSSTPVPPTPHWLQPWFQSKVDHQLQDVEFGFGWPLCAFTNHIYLLTLTHSSSLPS